MMKRRAQAKAKNFFAAKTLENSGVSPLRSWKTFIFKKIRKRI